jgi:hypothetical protein
VRVDRARNHGVLVAEPVGHDMERLPRSQQKGRVGVTRVVQADVRDPELLSGATPMLGGRCGLEVAAVWLRGDEVPFSCPMLT